MSQIVRLSEESILQILPEHKIQSSSFKLNKLHTNKVLVYDTEDS